MTEFGDRDPLLDHEEKDKDDEDEDSDEEEVNRNPFETGGGASETGDQHEMQERRTTQNRENEKDGSAETSFIESRPRGSQGVTFRR